MGKIRLFSLEIPYDGVRFANQGIWLMEPGEDFRAFRMPNADNRGQGAFALCWLRGSFMVVGL